MFCVPVSLRSHSVSLISPSSGPYSPSQSFTIYHLHLFRLLTHKRWSMHPKHIISHAYSYLLWIEMLFFVRNLSVPLFKTEPREPPSELQAFAISSSEIKVTWKPPSPGPGRPQGYEVRESEMHSYISLLQNRFCILMHKNTMLFKILEQNLREHL